MADGRVFTDAFQLGFKTADLLSNPYPDGSNEARLFVDGWVAGRKWEKSQPHPKESGDD